MNDNVTQSFNPRIDNPNHFSGLKPICLQEFYKDKRLSINCFALAACFRRESRAPNKISKAASKKKKELRHSETRKVFLYMLGVGVFFGAECLDLSFKF